MTVMRTESRTESPAGDAEAEPRVDACASAEVAHPRPGGRDQCTIGEVASFTGLSAHTLRRYERIGLMPHGRPAR